MSSTFGPMCRRVLPSERHIMDSRQTEFSSSMGTQANGHTDFPNQTTTMSAATAPVTLPDGKPRDAKLEVERPWIPGSWPTPGTRVTDDPHPAFPSHRSGSAIGAAGSSLA